jgi:hypothetical protein
MIDESANGTTSREERLNEVLLAYVEGAQEGRPPDRRRLIAANPDCARSWKSFRKSGRSGPAHGAFAGGRLGQTDGIEIGCE